MSNLFSGETKKHIQNVVSCNFYPACSVKKKGLLKTFFFLHCHFHMINISQKNAKLPDQTVWMCRANHAGADSEGGGSLLSPFDSNFHSWEILDKFDKFLSLFLTLFNKFILLPVNVRKIAGWVANSVDPDQMLCSAVSDLGLHCLLQIPTISMVIWLNWTPSKILLDPPCHGLHFLHIRSC